MVENCCTGTCAYVCVCSYLCSVANIVRAMKREREDGGGPPGKRAGIVRLNVGGSHFDTTRSTLSKCTYFAPFLDGRMSHATDEDGRLFNDRSGEYFSRILQFLRTPLCPSPAYVAQTEQG